MTNQTQNEAQSSVPFDRFEELLRDSLIVPKSELNRRLAEAKAERDKARAERKAKQAAPSPRGTKAIGTASSDRA